MKYNHFSYGEMIATRHKLIKHNINDVHFFRSTETEEVTELDARLSQAHDVVLVAIDGKNSDYEMNGADALIETPQYFFAILKQTNSTDDTTIADAQEESKSIASHIIAYMLRDQLNRENGLDDLDASSFTVRGIGAFGDNFYGVMLGFNMKPNVSYEVDENIWEV
jgi:hypothetical protein